MRKSISSLRGERAMPSKNSADSRGDTTLSTPATTSLGLFHQHSSVARANYGSSRESPLPPTPRRASLGGGQDDGLCKDLLERHTNAAKEGVIEVLTARASKLGGELEREMVAKKEVQDRADKVQARLDEETAERKDLEHLLEKQKATMEVLARDGDELRWELNALRAKMDEQEQRSSAWIKEESEKRKSAEDALAKEHAIATEYFRAVGRDTHQLTFGKQAGAATDILVKDLNDQAQALRDCGADLGRRSAKLEDVLSDLKYERERGNSIQDHLSTTQEKFDAAKRKVRQLSSQLEAESSDNEALRRQVRAMDEDNLIRARELQERKAKAQQRKRGDARNMMAESRTKDDRIKKLERALMEERARLEADLQTARSGYEESAKESRRKIAQLQRRCLSLEYKLATRLEATREQDDGDGSTLAKTPSTLQGPRNVADGTGHVDGDGSLGLLSSKYSSLGTDGAPSTGSSSSGSALATEGPISVTSMLPWRRKSTSAQSTASEVLRPTGETKTGIIPSATNAMVATPGSGVSAVRSASRLPDPSRHNESAPAWMRADLTVNRVEI